MNHPNDPAIGYLAFDAAYSDSIRNTIRLLQRSVNATDDGIITPQTLADVNAMMVQDVPLKFNAASLPFYTDLDTWVSFGKGRVRRIADNLKFMTEDA